MPHSLKVLKLRMLIFYNFAADQPSEMQEIAKNFDDFQNTINYSLLD